MIWEPKFKLGLESLVRIVILIYNTTILNSYFQNSYFNSHLIAFLGDRKDYYITGTYTPYNWAKCKEGTYSTHSNFEAAKLKCNQDPKCAMVWERGSCQHGAHFELCIGEAAEFTNCGNELNPPTIHLKEGIF